MFNTFKDKKLFDVFSLKNIRLKKFTDFNKLGVH